MFSASTRAVLIVKAVVETRKISKDILLVY
jgi:hypothetical protein